MGAKEREDADVIKKDRVAAVWSESATWLTGVEWRCVKVMQRNFEQLAPATFEECATLGMVQMSMFA